ncbi:MAG: hypothetical protein ACOZHQ_09180 [Thermodesulfobacteriota bacterium]
MSTTSHRSQDFAGLYRAETLRTHRRDLRIRWAFLALMLFFLLLTLVEPKLGRYFWLVLAACAYVTLYNLWYHHMLRQGLPPPWFNYVTTTLDMLGLLGYQLGAAYAYSPLYLASTPSTLVYPFLLFHTAHRLDYRLLTYALILALVCFNLPYLLTQHALSPAELATIPTAGPVGQLVKSLLLLGLGLHYLLIPIDTIELLEKQELEFQSRRILADNYQRELEREVESKTQILTLANRELQKALDDVKTLRGLLPICARCKKIRDEAGQWQSMEAYISSRTPASITHGLCRDCLKALYPEISAEVMADLGEADPKT